MSPVSIKSLIDDFLAGRARTTLEAYKGDLRDFAIFLDATTVDEAARELLKHGHGAANRLVVRYKTALLARAPKERWPGGASSRARPTDRAKTLAPATVARRLAAVRSLVRFARLLGLVNWTIDVQAPRVERVRDARGPGRDAVAAMRVELESRGTRKATRDHAIVRLLHDLALRRSEVVSLDLEHLDKKGRELLVLGKGRRTRERITVPERTMTVVAAWLRIRGKKAGPLFLSLDPARKGSGRLTASGIYKIVRQLGEDLGLRARPHGLRHTAATTALHETKGDLRAVAAFGRWDDLRTLRGYDDDRKDVGGEVARKVAASLEQEPGRASNAGRELRRD